MILTALIDWWTQSAFPVLDSAAAAVLPERWNYGFMRLALLECVLLAPISAAMGVQVVNFRLAFFSDAIAHSAFAGVAIGFLLAGVSDLVDPRLTMILFGLLVGWGIAAVRRKTDLSSDTVIGVFFSTVVAFGIAIVTNQRQTGTFQRYLYGDILTLTPIDIAHSTGLAVLVLLFMLLGFNRLTLIGLNAELAHSRSIAVRAYDYAFSLLLALVVTVSIRIAGILLVTAMLVVPAAAARNLARSAGGMFWWAMFIGLMSGLIGIIASFSRYFEDVGVGAAIILAAACLFAISYLGRSR